MNKIIILLLIHISYLTNAQTFWSDANLNYGKYQVGFNNYTKNDDTRTYSRIYDWDNVIHSRPMSISIWYPTNEAGKGKRMKVEDYMVILKQEEEWESMPNKRILSWFYSDSEHNRNRMTLETKAWFKAPVMKVKFPVVIYAPSYQASSTENFVLCEFLASHGYVVISSPSRGTENRFLSGGTTKDIETQARDIEFLIGEASSVPFVDINKLAVAGFSFGGISNVLAQMKNEKVKAIVCLDGSVKYQLGKLLASPFADLSKVDVPFIFMSQKDIPMEVMKADKIDMTLNNQFWFYDSLKFSDAYYLKFNDLTHSYFSSMGVLFQERDLRQDKNDSEIIMSYGWVNQYALNFLNVYLKDNNESLQFMKVEPGKNGVKSDVITIDRKKSQKRKTTFEDFNESAMKQGYKDLESLNNQIKDQNPDFKLQEWKLNNLGLQLVFKKKFQEGISILSLATQLFPNSANAFDSLAEGYLEVGNDQLAIVNFNQSLKLDPQNQNAIDKLKIVKRK